MLIVNKALQDNKTTSDHNELNKQRAKQNSTQRTCSIYAMDHNINSRTPMAALDADSTIQTADLTRTTSSSVNLKTPTKARNSHRPTDMPTPPTSPPHGATSPVNVKIDMEALDTLRSSLDDQRPNSYTKDGIISCPFNVEYVHDQNSEKQIFGYGAWSTVYKGSGHLKNNINAGLWTPPSRSVLPPLVVAVKTPARKDAVNILRSEAQALTRLCELDISEKYVATFHGIIDNESALVLAAYPLSLEDHIRSCATAARSHCTTDNMSAPVIGNISTWLDLATKLIEALDWMHNEALIVHGDIKPGNILLCPVPESALDESCFPYQPLFIDFSSSQRLDAPEVTENTLSAVTMEYTAPELLTSAVLKDSKSCATTDSDVFSLAVTLLVAATGDPLVYTGYSGMQRQMMARQGWGILNNIRSLSNRVPRHGVVSRALERAVLKKDLGRNDAKTWKAIVDGIRRDMNGPLKV